MKIVIHKPKTEPLFQAEIYRTRQETALGSEILYRVVIGSEGTDVPQKIGKFIDYFVISDFMGRAEIEKWIAVQAAELKKAGHNVEVDESPSYQMVRALEELALGTPSRAYNVVFNPN